MIQRKNILLIITDDQRYNTIHCLGNSDIITPNLDALCANGTAFTNAHTQGGTSGAICMPSRAMLFTGRSLFHIENEGQSIPPEHITLPQMLKNNGYSCFGTGKWHNGTPAFARSFTCGENIFFGGMWDHWNVPTSKYDPHGLYDNEINFVADFAHTNKTRRVHCDEFNPGIHSTQLVTNSAINYLKTRPHDMPFFMNVSYLAPHDPRTMPQRFKNMYYPEKIKISDNFLPQHPFNFGIENIRDEVLLPTPRCKEDVKQELCDYYAMITHLDYEIGRLLEQLKASGEYDNTIIIFTSDNGLSLGSQGLLGKQNLYEESIRVPLIFVGDDIPRNCTNNAFVYQYDIFATICRILELQPPESCEGKSFADTLMGAKTFGRDTLYFAYNELIRGVKQGDYKLIEYHCQEDFIQLYNLAQDASECHNLASHSPEKVRQLQQLLSAQRNKYEDTQHPYSNLFWRQK